VEVATYLICAQIRRPTFVGQAAREVWHLGLEAGGHFGGRGDVDIWQQTFRAAEGNDEQPGRSGRGTTVASSCSMVAVLYEYSSFISL
jgi:hypothetical protein